MALTNEQIGQRKMNKKLSFFFVYICTSISCSEDHHNNDSLNIYSYSLGLENKFSFWLEIGLGLVVWLGYRYWLEKGLRLGLWMQL